MGARLRGSDHSAALPASVVSQTEAKLAMDWGLSIGFLFQPKERAVPTTPPPVIFLAIADSERYCVPCPGEAVIGEDARPRRFEAWPSRIQPGSGLQLRAENVIAASQFASAPVRSDAVALRLSGARPPRATSCIRYATARISSSRLICGEASPVETAPLSRSSRMSSIGRARQRLPAGSFVGTAISVTRSGAVRPRASRVHRWAPRPSLAEFCVLRDRCDAPGRLCAGAHRMRAAS